MTTVPVEPIAAAPAPSASAQALACPFCHSTQFVVSRKWTAMAHLLFWTGLAISVVSIPLVFLLIGIVTLPLGLVMVAIGPFVRKYVNVCLRCKRRF